MGVCGGVWGEWGYVLDMQTVCMRVLRDTIVKKLFYQKTLAIYKYTQSWGSRSFTVTIQTGLKQVGYVYFQLCLLLLFQ